jgi:mannose-6-phosphate isomerase-like protein (cupin superfamily)
MDPRGPAGGARPLRLRRRRVEAAPEGIDTGGPAGLRPWQVGDVIENPVTKEWARILELPWQNPEGRSKAEMIARVGSRVVGEHTHPGASERFTVLEGELTAKRDGATSVLGEGGTVEVSAGRWHDWWNGSDRDARVMVEVTPGARFGQMLETMFGLANLGYVDPRGMPDLLQLVMIGREFADVVQFRTPPPAVQKVTFALLAPLAHALGYRGTCPQISRFLATRQLGE